MDREMEGLSIGKKENKLGMRARSTCEVILENVRGAASHVVGQPGNGYKVAIETLNEGRIGIGAQMTGIADAALGAALSYPKERKQVGKSISDFQGVQFQLAKMATELEMARLLVYDVARVKEEGKTILREAHMDNE